MPRPGYLQRHSRPSAAQPPPVQPDVKRAAVDAAMATGRRYVRSCEFGNTMPVDLAGEFCRADEAVLRPIRSLLDLGEATTVRNAAAPLPPDVAAFFAESGELTPTFKLRRRVVHAKYADVLGALYAD